MRINKLFSNFGLCSRKEANRWIADGRITVNGQLAILGQWVELEDEILLDGQVIREKKKVYMALNKPVGITCTAAEDVEDNIINFIKYPDYIFPIGRLDKESQGLILLTNDGDLANEILDSHNNHEKEYIVGVHKKINDEFIMDMSQGVDILGGKTRPCILSKIDEYTFRIVLTQGLNRQIRRMTRALGYNVTKLQRVRILNIEIGDLKDGSWRYLSKAEIYELKNII